MQFDIEYLFAERCICGAARDDGTFCAACRSKHEHLLSAAPTHAADPLPGICKNCFQPHPTYRCPEIRAALFAPVIERAA